MSYIVRLTSLQLKISPVHRIIEDYAVVYFGSSIFKICRLLMVATLCVHIFACIYFRVKIDYANSPDDVINFYVIKNVDPDVRITDDAILNH